MDEHAAGEVDQAGDAAETAEIGEAAEVGGVAQVGGVAGQARELVRLAAQFLRHAQHQADAVPAELAELLRANGLAARHLHALIPLAVDGPLIVNHLADRLALAPASVSQLVNELRRAGLVSREPDPADRRRALITIRPDLRAPVAAIAAARVRPFQQALTRMTEADRAQFLRGWQLLIEAHTDSSEE